LLEPFGPLQACDGTALPFFMWCRVSVEIYTVKLAYNETAIYRIFFRLKKVPFNETLKIFLYRRFRYAQAPFDTGFPALHKRDARTGNSGWLLREVQW